MRLSDLSEDLSRRDFLKTTGKAAMAAVAPKSSITKLVNSATQSPNQIANYGVPKTPAEMKAALLRWIKDNDFETHWRKLAKENIFKGGWKGIGTGRKINGRQEVIPIDKLDTPIGQQAVKKNIEQSVKDDYEEILSLANPSYDEPAYFEDLQHVLNNWSDDPGMLKMTNGQPLPDWVIRYKVSQFLGKDVGMDHPFVTDRETWLEQFYSGVWGTPDPKMETELANIIRTSASPERVKDLIGDGDDLESAESDQPERPEEPKAQQIQDYEPDSWNTRSIEFEQKLNTALTILEYTPEQEAEQAKWRKPAFKVKYPGRVRLKPKAKPEAPKTSSPEVPRPEVSQ